MPRACGQQTDFQEWVFSAPLLVQGIASGPQTCVPGRLASSQGAAFSFGSLAA